MGQVDARLDAVHQRQEEFEERVLSELSEIKGLISKQPPAPPAAEVEDKDKDKMKWSDLRSAVGIPMVIVFIMWLLTDILPQVLGHLGAKP